MGATIGDDIREDQLSATSRQFAAKHIGHYRSEADVD